MTKSDGQQGVKGICAAADEYSTVEYTLEKKKRIFQSCVWKSLNSIVSLIPTKPVKTKAV